VALGAIEAGQVHAAEEVIGGVVLHVQHDKVVDLLLARRRGPGRLHLAKACPDASPDSVSFLWI
jgi:hypothetical protein